MSRIIKSVFIITFNIVLFAACNNNPSQNKSEKITITAILPLTGNAAVAGEYSKNGLQLAVAEINGSGGIAGNVIDISYEDSKGDPKEGVNLIMKANTVNKPSIVYSQLSGVSLAIKPITEKNNQILIAVSGAGNLLDSSKYTLRNYIEPDDFTKIVASTLSDSFHVNKIGILYANSEFGSSIYKSLLNNLKAKNIEVTFENAFDEKANDYRTLVEKFKQSKTQNVYIIGIGKSLGLVYKTLKELRYNGEIYGGIESTLPDVKNTVGKLGEGITYFDFAYSPNYEMPGYKVFSAKYKSKFNSDPQIPAVLSYSAIMTIAHNLDSVLKTGNQVVISAGEFPQIKLANKNFVHPIQIKTF